MTRSNNLDSGPKTAGMTILEVLNGFHCLGDLMP